MTSTGSDGSVEFRFFRPDASDVAVAADFSAWTPDLPMRRDEQGWWTLQLQLEPGEYRFRYVADGQWYTDFASNGVEVNRLGWNSVLVVPGTPKARGDDVVPVELEMATTTNTQYGGSPRYA